MKFLGKLDIFLPKVESMNYSSPQCGTQLFKNGSFYTMKTQMRLMS